MHLASCDWGQGVIATGKSQPSKMEPEIWVSTQEAVLK